MEFSRPSHGARLGRFPPPFALEIRRHAGEGAVRLRSTAPSQGSLWWELPTAPESVVALDMLVRSLPVPVVTAATSSWEGPSPRRWESSVNDGLEDRT